MTMNKYMKNFNGEKVFSLEYDKETLRDMVIEKQEEIERLNNIINELEKGLRSLYDFDKGVISKDYLDCVDDTLEKLQELKGSE